MLMNANLLELACRLDSYFSYLIEVLYTHCGHYVFILYLFILTKCSLLRTHANIALDNESMAQ